jgi:dTDP-4-amino-4,6-dideoxygalactose transaminase
MTEWQGAILLAQLERLPDQMAVRAENARYLTQELSKIDGIATLPDDPRVTSHGNHVFMFRHRSAGFGEHTLAEFVAALSAEGIQCMTGYAPLYRSPAIIHAMTRRFGAAPQPDCPVTERLCQETVWIPQNVLLGSRADMDSIVEAIAKIKKAWA